MLHAIARRTIEIVVAASLLLTAAVAEGVTPAPLVKDAESVDSVTTGAATRARADVQIRRIKNLMLSKGATEDTDADFDRLEKLQKDLRGQN